MVHQCLECLKNFTQFKNYKRHVAKFHPEKLPEVASEKKPRKSLEFKCHQCIRQFSKKTSLKTHVNQKHRSEADFVRGPSQIKCALCQSEIIKVKFEKHLQTEHDLQVSTKILSFASYEEFIAWKNTLEEESATIFINTHGTKKLADGSQKIIFHCHRSGNYKPMGKNVRNLKLQGTKKINAYCPASIKLVIAKDNRCSVKYLETHIGHINDNDLCHLTLTKAQRQYLAAKIAAKIPFDNILDEVRNSIRGKELKRIHLLTKQDLLNIENAFNLGGHERRHKNDALVNYKRSTTEVISDDALSVDALVEEFNDNDTTMSENYPELNSQDIPENAMDESKVIVSHLSQKKTNSLEVQQNNLINNFTQLVHRSDTQEAIDIVKNQLFVIDSKLRAVQVLKEKRQEFDLKIQSQKSN